MPDLDIGRQGTIQATDKMQLLSSATFKIEADGQFAVFSELGGISSEVEMSEYMEAGARGPMYGRFVGRAKPPIVSLKRALSTGVDTTWIWLWHGLARQGGAGAYKQTTLGLYLASNPDRAVKTYMLHNAFPSKVEIMGMKAGGTEVVLQTVTLQCDEIIDAP